MARVSHADGVARILAARPPEVRALPAESMEPVRSSIPRTPDTSRPHKCVGSVVGRSGHNGAPLPRKERDHVRFATWARSLGAPIAPRLSTIALAKVEAALLPLSFKMIENRKNQYF